MTSRLDEFLRAEDPEHVLFRHLRESLASLRDRESACPPWQKGEPLRVLLGGYLGAGNVGSEMRSHEIVRHLTHLLGKGNASFTVLINGPYRSAIAGDQISFTTLEGYIPDALINLASRHSAVVAIEGSMLKSSFSNVLSGIMIGALAAADRLAVGYGAEIGEMDFLLEDFARDVLQSALFLCRNEPSRVRASQLGLRSEGGSDTAWTFDAMGAAESDAHFRRSGVSIDGPIVVVCPTNPFWWPVRPNPGLAARAETDVSLRQWRYADVFFHTFNPDRQRRFERYADEMAVAARVIGTDRRADLLLLAMDPTDGPACRALRDRLGPSVPIIYGHEHPIGAIAGLLRRAAFLVSSRYHALVAAAPGGTPFAGVSTDERIVNLLASCGAGSKNVPAYEDELAVRLIAISRGTVEDEVRHATRALVRREVFACGRMGLAFIDEVRRRLPGFPVPSRPPQWDAHLPPLPPAIEELMSA